MDTEWPGGLSHGDYVGNIAFIDQQHGLLSGIRYGDLMATADGGHTWRGLGGPGMRGSRVGLISPQVGCRLGFDTLQGTDVLTMTRDGGETWTRYNLGDLDQPRNTHRCGLVSLCVESGGGPYGIVSHDNGQTWAYYRR